MLVGDLEFPNQSRANRRVERQKPDAESESGRRSLRAGRAKSLPIALSLVPLQAERPDLDLLDMEGRWVEVESLRCVGYGSPPLPIRVEVRGDEFVFRREAAEEIVKVIDYDPTTKPRRSDYGGGTGRGI